jgi:hypothetical protein
MHPTRVVRCRDFRGRVSNINFRPDQHQARRSNEPFGLGSCQKL